jgi:hypothetical protein
MSKAAPHLTAADLAALRALASGGGDISPVSRYWLSVYALIDETPRGWLLTPRGHEFLRQPVAQQRIEAVAADDPRVLAAAAAAAQVRRRRRRLSSP